METDMEISTPAKEEDIGADGQEGNSGQQIASLDETATDIFPFMELPKELRLEIYSYLSRPVYRPIDCVSPRRLGYWPITIYHRSLLVCRTIYEEAMDALIDREPAAIACRTDQQAKYTVLQTALNRGYAVDHEKGNEHELRVKPEAVEVALQYLLHKIPYGKRRSHMWHHRLQDLRHFFAQTLMRLRRYPVMDLTVIVKTRPFSTWHGWAGSETCARARAWYVHDTVELRFLHRALQYAVRRGETDVTTRITIRGDAEDKVFEQIKASYSDDEDVACRPLGEKGYAEYPAYLGKR
jgi:hypothetical protein